MMKGDFVLARSSRRKRMSTNGTSHPVVARREPEHLRSIIRETETYSAATVPSISIPVIEIIKRANDFLRNSATDAYSVRQDRYQELELYLAMSNNPIGYDYLEHPVRDPTRRQYRIPQRLNMSPQYANVPSIPPPAGPNPPGGRTLT